jgi:tRNA 2-(methylsulfanyl)-N6-isopentenyladenosine37 hydroxylase
MISLLRATPKEWTRGIVENFDVFLADHADCERKASAAALHFVAKCPDKTLWMKPLIRLAQEELEHFREVYERMECRGLRLNRILSDDPYVNALLALCRNKPEERTLDRLILTAIIESRGAERFALVADAMEDAAFKDFYHGLAQAERRHGKLFVKLAAQYYAQRDIDARLTELLEAEDRIVRELPWRPSLH